MPSETPFRITLAVILVLTTAMMTYHRLRAARSGERISHKEEGLFFAVSLRLIGLCMWIGTFAYLIDPTWMQWAALALPTWLRWSGAIASMLFFGLMFWTLTNLGDNLTDTVVTRTNAKLVTAGPYHFVRHPFYVSTGLLIFGVTLLTANWFIGLSGLLCLAMLIVRTPMEEKKLIDKFGDEYRAYMATTGRFYPKTAMWKHIRAILLLPGIMTVLIPATIIYRSGTDTFDLSSSAPIIRIGMGMLGILFIGIGLALFVATNRLFATIGRGTLAPWNPTGHLVVEGVYRHARNPMISGVFATLLGESLVAASRPLFFWFLLFVTINMIFIPFFEESDLLRRFGSAYEEYREHVPRWIPRSKPWSEPSGTK